MKYSVKPKIKPMTPEEAQAIRDRDTDWRSKLTPAQREKFLAWSKRLRELTARTTGIK